MKSNFKLQASLLTALLGCTLLATAAEVPPAEKLLPDDTLGLITTPDWDKVKSAYHEFPAAQMWNDPAMKPFTDKFINKFKTDVQQPLERELGIKFEDYSNLAHGQMTVALIQNGWKGETNLEPALVLLIDTKDKSEQARKSLGELKKKWIDAGKQVKTDTVRDVEFTTLILSSADLNKALSSAFPDKKDNATSEDNKPADAPKSTEISVGQSGSLLLIGNNLKVFEKILIRLSGGSLPSLGEVPAYEANHTALFREANLYGWVNFKTMAEIVGKAAAAKAAATPNPMGFTPEKVMDALGINGIKSLAMAGRQTPDGALINLFVTVPQAERKGFFKVLAFDAKDASPPAFVPADVSKFSRWRLDGQKMWANLEGVLTDISPQMGGLLQMTLGAAGKDKDPNFDIKKQLIGNLGDDIVNLEKPPRSTKAQDLNTPPALVLLSSANADQLTSAIRVGIASLTGGNGEIKDREFLGRKIYTLPLPPAMSADGSKMEERSLSFSPSGGYVAMSTTPNMVEEYLRSGENPSRPLRETAGLNEAAEKIGGMGTGFFGYDNQSETIKLLIEALKQDPDTFDRLFPSNPLTPKFVDPQARKLRDDWLDFSLLPSFDKIAKYFNYTVYNGTITADGLSFKSFSPTPPQLRK